MQGGGGEEGSGGSLTPFHKLNILEAVIVYRMQQVPALRQVEIELTVRM